MDTTDRLLRDLAEHFNHGVETGDFRKYSNLFAPEGVLRFHGVPMGPYRGKTAIEAGYRHNPPDDEIEVLDSHVRAGTIVAGFAWLREPDIRAGEMRIVLNDDAQIASLEVVV